MNQAHACPGEPDWLRPSIEIRALNNLIGRYWNVCMPEESRISGSNTPIILYLNERRDEDVFQYDIERTFSITRSTASRVLGLMEKKGLIERTRVDWDARVRKITLTPKAQDFVAELNRTARNLEGTLLKGFTDGEQHQLMDMLATMKQNLMDTGLVGSCRGSDGTEPEEGMDPDPPEGPQAAPTDHNVDNQQSKKKGEDGQ
ncbi:MAG: MarR family winged helix-turn-helix transcriptional regulator [Bifidobacterium sp.]|nr:MarR family winged helix-turn-helix transcriptional regulator [Bifidobacterium sp.]